MEIEFLTLKEAKERNLKRYFSKDPCKKGHYPCERNTYNRGCILCINERQRENYSRPEVKIKISKSKKDYNSLPEVKERVAKYYREKGKDYFSRPEIKERIKEYQKEYYSNRENKIRYDEYQKEYRSIPEIRNKLLVQKKEYYNDNREWIKAQHKEYQNRPEVRKVRLAKNKEWRENNKELVLSKCAWRRAAKLQRTVAWADKKKIEEFYILARKLTEETGIQHHVDHIIPLLGKTVSGLHVETNLRVITATENLSKNNKLIEDLL